MNEMKISLSEKKAWGIFFFISVSESQFYEYLFYKFCVITHSFTYLAFTVEQQSDFNLDSFILMS